MIRPDPPDQPSPEETARLVASLRTSVEAARRRAMSTVVRAPTPGRLIRVTPGGETTEVALEEHGQTLVSRTVGTVWLIGQLDGAPSFATLAALLD